MYKCLFQSSEDVSDAWKELGLNPSLLSAIKNCGFAFPLPIQSYCIPAAVKKRRDVLGAAQTGSGKTLAFGIPILQRILEEAKEIHDPPPRLKDHQMPIPESSDSEELVELTDSEEETQEVKNEGDEIGEDLAISDSEIARLDQKLGVVSYGDICRKQDPRTSLKALILTPTRELALQACKQLQEIAREAKIRVVPVIGGMAPQKQTRLLNCKNRISFFKNSALFLQILFFFYRICRFIQILSFLIKYCFV